MEGLRDVGKQYAFLTYAQRVRIELLLEKHMPVPRIARELELERSTVYREITRGTDSKGRYHADLGQAVFNNAIKRRGRRTAPAGAVAAERMA